MGCVNSRSNKSKTNINSGSTTVSADSSVKTNSYSNPSSQSHELSIVPINPIVPIQSEKKTIEDYITAAVKYRNEHGGHCNLETQLRRKRRELICVGAFIIQNTVNKKYTILSYDRAIVTCNGKRIRPDLILQDNFTNVIVHIEIDEHGHRRYDAEEEKRREDTIAEYYNAYDYMRIRFNPDVYDNLIEMAIMFTQILSANDGLLAVNYIPSNNKFN